MADGPQLRVDDVDAAADHAQPQPAVRVGQQAGHAQLVGGAAAGGADRRHRARQRIVLAQRPHLADEDDAAALAEQRHDVVFVQAVGGVGLVADAARAAQQRIDHHDAAVGAVRAQPDLAQSGLDDGGDAFLVQGRRRAALAHRRRVGAPRLDDEGAVGARADPDAAGAVLHQHADVGAAVAALQRHGRRRAVAALELEQAFARADPQVAVAFAQQRAHPAGRHRPGVERGGRGGAARHTALGVDVVEAAAGAHPQAAGAVVGQRRDLAVAQPGGAGGDAHEIVMFGVVADQAARTGAHPQPSPVVDQQAGDVIVGQGVVARRVGDEFLRPVAVPAHQPGLGADPHEAAAVLREAQAGAGVGLRVVVERGVGQPGPAVGLGGQGRARGREQQKQ
jgi:hypothetical protein